jgi:AcrR family transcriptional regulator
MARIAKGRDRVLTREEIAAETLREFDESADAPSIRALASALGVAPSAIYHHYESQAAIVQAATELVWEEATATSSPSSPIRTTRTRSKCSSPPA